MIYYIDSSEILFASDTAEHLNIMKVNFWIYDRDRNKIELVQQKNTTQEEPKGYMD